MRKLVPLPALLLATASPAAAERPVFSATTEAEWPHPRDAMAGPELVRLVLAALDRDDVGRLDTCIAEQRLPAGSHYRFFRALGIRSGQGRTMWFVRPTLRPYCPALYGAHLFRYFLFEERAAAAGPQYRLVFRGGGDRFAAYPTLHHGLNDIEATGCTAAGCDSVRMAFDGREYRPVRCTRTMFEARREITRPVRCPRS